MYAGEIKSFFEKIPELKFLFFLFIFIPPFYIQFIFYSIYFLFNLFFCLIYFFV